MSDTISQLDTATTDELIAALVARHRATVGQATSQLTTAGQVTAVAVALTNELNQRIGIAVVATSNQFLSEHPAVVQADAVRQPGLPPGWSSGWSPYGQ